MTKPEKNHETGLRILEILKILLEQDITRNDLIEKLKDISPSEHVYSQEVILKYFNTFKLLGLEFKKNKYTYGLENALYQINFSRQELKFLHKTIENISKLNNKTEEELMHKIIHRFDKYTNHNLMEVLERTIAREKYIHNSNIKENVITTLKNMIFDNQNVIISYIKSNGEEDIITIELKEIVEKKHQVYLVCYDFKLGRNKKICIDSITSIKQSPRKSVNISHLNTVVFKISGRLASVYKLKPSEKVLEFTNNYLIISNAEEDKDVLIHRLLKYGENCKILRPKYIQDDFKVLTEKILKNLEVC